MSRFVNDDPFAPWNCGNQNDPFAPWNDPFGHDRSGRFREYDVKNWR